MATPDWACHLLGLIFTPVSWRAAADEIAFCLDDAEAAAAIAYDGASKGAAAISNCCYTMEKGRVVAQGPPAVVMSSEEVRKRLSA